MSARLTDADRLVREETALLTAGVALQQEGLRLLLAEMRALAALLPGDAQHPSSDAEVEAEFDNLPV